ncbi:hypothetical protein HK100_010262 [Physocladia obscura]|uniref:Beta-hexosaminidase n=1 Tax=Physocladia obscura TaxID=109957 RepID=A0AAD5XES5_9FUNG|nr:hypothetical protein HK100_010262 [Physocladia obscura]
MKFLVILASIAVAVQAQASTSPISPVPHNLLWPRPQQFTNGTTDYSVDPHSLKFNLKFSQIANGNDVVIRKAVNRLKDAALKIGCPATGTAAITQVFVSVTGIDPTDLAQADESYTLVTDATSVTITAKNTVGALHGLQTLTQLIKPNERIPFHVETNTAGCQKAARVGIKTGFVIPSGPWSISDSPSYSWRGVSLDTSRNYIPVSSILRTLDGMAATKLNILHWHLVDATAFPVVSKTYPELRSSAYSPLSIYTYTDVQEIIAYAADLGIRVIPEFDTPAHTYSLSFAKELAPFVLCPNGGAGGTNSFWPTCPEPPCGNVNVADPGAAPAIAKLLKEYAGLFADSVLHLGGDEIENYCLNVSPQFTDIAFGKGNPVPATGTAAWSAGLATVYQSYIDTLLETTSAAGKQTMHWEDIVLNDGVVLPNNTIIQVWNSWDNTVSKNSLQKALALDRYQIVDTNSEYYYLDGGSGAWLTDRGFGPGGNSWEEAYWIPYIDWERIYTHDPRTSPIENTTDTTGSGYSTINGVIQVPTGNLQSIIGAEAAIWGERIGDSNLDTKLWPRAACAAEALWSADSFPTPSNKDFFEALPRLQVFRDRLISQGFGAEVLQPAWCLTNQCSAAFSGYPSNLAYGNEKPTYW